MNMASDQFEKTTRTIFDELHRAQGEDPYIFKRLSALLSTEYLKVDSDWFVGKTCLDAGCGSNANATHSMLSMGAEKVYAMDLDSGQEDNILKTVPAFLAEFEGRYEVNLGNVLNLDYQDDFFDFTHCSGVLHHSHDVYRGLGELARVTKPGGTLYIMLNGRGGLLRDFGNFLRQKYEQEPEFKFLIDNLSEDQFADTYSWFSSEMAEQGDDFGQKIPEDLFAQLFDRDLVLTIKDRITSPVYHEHSEEELVDWLNGHGFTNVERLSRYPKYRNIRRFLSPLYYRYDHPMARFLYGSGAVQLKALKAK